MSSCAVSSSLFQLAFLTIAAVWCCESVFRSALLCSSFYVWILHSSPPFICVVHQGPCATHHHRVIVYCVTIWLLNIVPSHSQTCFLIPNMTERSDQSMEAASASANSLEAFITQSINRMDSQEASLSNTGRAVQALVAQVSELTQQFQHLRVPTAPPTPPVSSTPPETLFQSEPRLPVPESYSGEPSFCRAFLTRCSMHFSLQPRTFNNEQTKVAFVLMLLTGRAALWGTAVWENQDPCCASFQALSGEMRRVFDRAVAGREAARILADLRQGERSVSDYSIEFRTLAAECRWNEEAQWDMFLHGLADRVQKEIYVLDLPTTLNGLIDLALRVDARLARVEQRVPSSRVPGGAESQRFSGGDVVSSTYDHEPMQVGRARLSREEKERRRSQGLCLYCGGAGHYLNKCPVKDQAR